MNGTSNSERKAVARGALGVALALAAGWVLLAPAAASASGSATECTGDPLFITDKCTDPRFHDPVIDLVEARTTPVPHTFMHGHFPGTDARFAFYFPPAAKYKGRFILGPTHQLTNNENGRDPSFAFASGAYLVATNLGGSENPLLPLPIGAADTSIRGYRVNTEAARFSRVVAQDFYASSHGKKHRPYGYIYGGSGGSYMTICAMQQTSGIWDGGVPFISANHMATPYTYNVRILALRLLRDTGINQFPAVMDAIDPGGSGDPYATLNEEQAEALREATRFGFPPRGWWDYANMTQGALTLTALEVPIQDPTYAADFWNVPGYAGFDDPFGTLASVRVQEAPGARTVLANLGFGLLLSGPPLESAKVTGAYLIADTGAAAGSQWPLVAVVPGQNIVVPFGGGFGFPPFNNVAPGNTVHIDNSLVVGLQYYNRYQDPQFAQPASEPDYYAWNAWRDGNGDPIYVQRDVTTGIERASSSAGCVENGTFSGKMAVVNNLMDIDATPWYADWYRSMVKNKLGNNIDKRYRLYYNDHAMHGNPTSPAGHARTIDYTGMLQQTVRDVMAWVEKGKTPPSNTRYWVDDGAQIKVPPLALLRGGMQPVVHLVADGHERVDISVGDTVKFTALVGVPLGAGRVVSAEWDFLGVGNYPEDEVINHPSPWVVLTAEHTYTTPGTYFPVLRAASQRDGDASDTFTQVNNLARVRVVVSP